MIEPKEAIFTVDFSDLDAPDGFWRVGYMPFPPFPAIASVFHYYFNGPEGAAMIEWCKIKPALYFIEATDDVKYPTYIFNIKTVQSSKEQFFDYLVTKDHPILDWFLFNQDLL